MKAALLLPPDERVERWQYDALRLAVDRGLEVVRVTHRDEPPPRHGSHHAGYRALTRASRVGLRSGAYTEVKHLIHAPAEAESSVDVVIDLSGEQPPGGGIAQSARLGVLFFHHGDAGTPTTPTGFDELRTGEAVHHIAVERLNGDLETVEVVSDAYARVVPYSYRRTRLSANEAAVPLLAQALEALEKGAPLKREPHGQAAPEPADRVAALQALRLGGRKTARLAYGLFVEKRWRVGRLPAPPHPQAEVMVPAGQLDTLPMPPGCSFVADCFAAPGGGVYVEAMNAKSGKGEIALWRDGTWRFLELGLTGGHASYPQPVAHRGEQYLLPEIARVASPTLYRLASDGVTVLDKHPLRGLEELRLVDATAFEHEGRWYLFAADRHSVGAWLDLWVAPDLFGPYEKHPASPICLDARGARMAGPIIEIDGRLYRYGQDGTRKYGGRVTTHRIDVLTPDRYAETRCGSFQITDAWGPHTVSAGEDGVWIDYFDEVRTPMAGVRRIKLALF